MDKEAQEKIVSFLSIAQKIGKDESYLDVWGNARTLLNQLEELGYRKLPKDKPPLLSEENCHQVDNPFDYNMGAEAQREADIEYYEGGMTNGCSR